MEVTLLYFEGCPNWQRTEARVRAALDRLGQHDVVISRRSVDSDEQAGSVGLPGSPTILIDGRDPFAEQDIASGRSCRMYRTEAGLRGAPTVDQLVEALG